MRHPRTRASSGLLVLFALLLGPLAAAAQEMPGSPTDTLPLDPALRSGVLENGLRYFVRANEQPENRAELRLVVNAGSVLEDEDQQGLAHLMEHMAFNGTANFEKQELVSYLESIGMEFGPEVNAYTSFDETVYMLQVPTDDPEFMATGFQILEDWAHRVSLEGEEIDKERGVVIEEWRLGRGANARMQEQQFPILFQGSRYAERLPIGDVEILESFQHETLRRFYRDWYRPDLMAVVAVGDFDAGSVEGQIQDVFSSIPVPEDPRPRAYYDVPGHDETLFAIATDHEATNTQVALLTKRPAGTGNTLEIYHQGLVEGLFTGMLNKRLFELTQQPDPPFAAGFSGKGRLVRTVEIFQLGALVREGGVARGMEALLTEAERVARHGFTASELEREKADFLRAMERAFAERENQESRSLAGEYVSHFLQGEPAPGIEYEFQTARALVPTITLEEVNQAARSWLVDENRVVLVNAPDREEVEVPAESRLEALFQQVLAADIQPYEDTATDEPLLAERPAPSPVVNEATDPELGLTEWTLANGVQVVLKPTDFKDDEILFQAFSPGGFSLSGEEEHMSASTAAQVVSLGGVGGFSQVDLQKRLAGRAVSVSPRIGELTEGLAGSASPKDLETLFQLIHLYFTAPRKDPTAFQAFQQQMEAVLSNRSASPMAAFQDTLTVALTQGHPRARPVSVERMREIDLDEAFAFYRDRFADAGDFTFLFVGSFEPARVRPLVETYLGGLPSMEREESWRDLDIDPPTGVVKKTVRKGVEPQSRTFIAFTGPFEYTPEKRLGMRALEGVMGIRLREVIREELSGSYGVSVQGGYEKYPEERYTLSISFGSDPQRVDELVETIFAELERIKTEGPTAEDIQKVKEQERRSRETNMERNAWWLAQLRAAEEHDSDPHFLLDMTLLDAVSPETVRADASTYIRTDNYVQVTLLPASGPVPPI